MMKPSPALWNAFVCCVLFSFQVEAWGASTRPSSRPHQQESQTQRQKRAQPQTRQAPRKSSLPEAKPDVAGQRLLQLVKEVKLANVMTFLLVRRPFAPVFSATIRVKAGGVDETTGLTGLAHILEHMAFKGTALVGTKDWNKEKALLRKVQRMGEALSLARQQSKGTLVKHLELRLKALQKKHSQWAKMEEFSRLYQVQGGKGLNASTGKDLTSYYISLPSNRLALWAQQEAARLAAPVFRGYYKERAVVAEERRMAMSKGKGRLYEAFLAAAFSAHPYRLPTVGWMSDITTIPFRALRQFFRRYYVPSNMVGSVVGDIDIPSTIKLLQRTFGKIPSGPPAPPVRTVEPKQQGERRVNVEFDARPQIYMGFHKPTAPHPDDDVFDLIEALLTQGRTSRLHKALVASGIVQDVWASSIPGSRFPNLFALGALPAGKATNSDVEGQLWRELKKLKTTLVSESELQRVRSQITMSYWRSLQSNQGLASKLSYYHAVVGSWKYVATQSQRLSRITPQDIQRVAKKYLKVSNRTIATLDKPPAPKELSLDDDKELNDTDLFDKPERDSPPKPRQPKPETSKPRAAQRKTPSKPKALTVQQKAARLLHSVQLVPMALRSLPKGLDTHPKDLKYPRLIFAPKRPQVVKLRNGLTLYLLPDNELPLVRMYTLFHSGRVYDPPEKLGLAEMTGAVMRTGGWGTTSGSALDHQLALRGANLTCRIDAEYGFASLVVHQRDTAWGMNQLLGMLRFPRFAKTQIQEQRSQMLAAQRRWNDDPFYLGFGHFRKFVYGSQNRWALRPTPQTIRALNRDDLVRFHKRYLRPQNIRVAITGNFKPEDMIHLWKAKVKGWTAPPTKYPSVGTMPKKTRPALVLVRKRIAQSVVVMGHLGPPRHHPQWMAARVMNHILGGGMLSRLFRELRTRRGLAYAAGSKLFSGPQRGLFVAYTGTQAKTTTQALQAMLEVLKQARNSPTVTANVLSRTQQALSNRFLFLFESPGQIVYRQAYFDFFGFPPRYLESYRQRLMRLTPKDIEKAIQSFLHPERFVILVVGWDPAFQGKPKLSSFGPIIRTQ